MSTPQPTSDRFAYTPVQAPPQQEVPLTALGHASSVMPPMPDPAVVFAGPGYNSPPPPTNPLAKGALLASILSAFFFFLAPVASVLAIIAWVMARSRQGVGARDARGALLLSVLFMSGWGALILWLMSFG